MFAPAQGSAKSRTATDVSCHVPRLFLYSVPWAKIVWEKLGIYSMITLVMKTVEGRQLAEQIFYLIFQGKVSRPPFSLGSF